MKIEDLWIGEWIKLLDTGETGKYEGLTSNQKLKINLGEKKITTDIENIIIIEKPSEKKSEMTIEVEEIDSVNLERFTNSIDLHIEILAPELKFSIPSRILNYQINSCKLFIEKAIYHKAKVIHIIHGKGHGVLKNEVNHLLKSFEEIKFSILSPSGGAMEVWLKD